MARAQKIWARRERKRLILLLGNACAVCGSTLALTFDCKFPQPGTHHKLSTDSRMTFYRYQHRLSNLQLLCSVCNAQKSVWDKLVLEGTFDCHHLSSPARGNDCKTPG